MNTLTQVKEIAEVVKACGGRLMLIGGCVRDEIMGLVPKDFDCEVYGLEPLELRSVLAAYVDVNLVGESFQVYKVGQDIDISIPRRDRKTGVGHKGFTVEGDPHMSFREACQRRDFTINAIMKDPLTGEIIDPFNGVKDIKNKRLYLVSGDAFSEDSLRVLRLAQFAGRFGFQIEGGTGLTAECTDLSDLPRERVWMELEKLFLKTKAENMAYGVGCLFKLEIAQKLFPSLKEYSNSRYFMASAVEQSVGLSEGEKLALLITVLTYESDLAVLDELGVTSVNGYNVRKTVEEMLEASHKYVFFDSDYTYHKMSQDVNMRLMGKLFYAFEQPNAYVFTNTVRRLGISEAPVKPLLQGKDLISFGMKPSPEMGKLLSSLYDKQLQGVSEEVLRQEASSLAQTIGV